MAKLLERFGGANQQSILLQGLSWREVPERINEVRFGANPDAICSLRAFPFMTQLGHSALQRHSAKIELLRGLR
jgi:hypothetical protein